MTYPIDQLQLFSDRLNERWDSRLRSVPAENIAIPAMGLCGEAAEVAAEVMMASGRASEHFKKHIRDGKAIVGNLELGYELGDVLHYWCRLTHLAGFTPGQIMAMNEFKLAKRRAEKSAAAAEQEQAAPSQW